MCRCFENVSNDYRLDVCFVIFPQNFIRSLKFKFLFESIDTFWLYVTTTKHDFHHHQTQTQCYWELKHVTTLCTFLCTQFYSLSQLLRNFYISQCNKCKKSIVNRWIINFWLDGCWSNKMPVWYRMISELQWRNGFSIELKSAGRLDFEISSFKNYKFLSHGRLLYSSQGTMRYKLAFRLTIICRHLLWNIKVTRNTEKNDADIPSHVVCFDLMLFTLWTNEKSMGG